MDAAVVNHMQGPLCGTLATMVLYGVLCMQTYQYVGNYPGDKITTKWLVACTWIIESVHTGFSIHFLEFYLIFNYNNPLALDIVVWTLPAAFACGFIVAWLVDLFFVWRIWQLGRQAWICILLATLATVRTAVVLANCVLGFQYSALQEYVLVVFPTMVAGWVLSAIADSLIALALCYYLRKRRSGMKRTEHIINRLLLYTINTGALTSVFAILTMILYLAIPESMVFAAFVQVESKLYAISLLASLNSRKDTLESARNAVSTAGNLPLHLFAPSEGTQPQNSFQPRIQITKSVEMETRGDDDSLQLSAGPRLSETDFDPVA